MTLRSEITSDRSRLRVYRVPLVVLWKAELGLSDLRRMVLGLTARGIHVRFFKESLTLTSEDSPMANLLLSVMSAFAQFERELIRERQREGIELAKKAGAYCGCKHSLTRTIGGKPLACSEPWE